MMNFTNAKENTMKGIASKSTLITFILASAGVIATAYLASKEIPKAKAEVKEILEKEDLTKAQKATESVKVVAKNTWKTAVVALGTILLVTGTAAITTANTAATVAGLTNIANMYEQKLKDVNEAIEENPNKKVKEEIKNAVNQKVVNRATSNISDEVLRPEESCPDKYVWIDSWTGAKFRATFQMVETASEIINLRIGAESYQTIFEFYEELIRQGAEFIGEAYPQLCSDFAWTHSIGLEKNVYHNDKGYTIHTIDYNEPTMDF